MNNTILNANGQKLYEKFERFHRERIDEIRKETGDYDYTEGWCVIDNSEYVKTLEDVCGIIIYGYDNDGIDHICEYIGDYGENSEYDLGFTARQVLVELMKYYMLNELLATLFIININGYNVLNNGN